MQHNKVRYHIRKISFQQTLHIENKAGSYLNIAMYTKYVEENKYGWQKELFWIADKDSRFKQKILIWNV